jgi:hypothetical protein
MLTVLSLSSFTALLGAQTVESASSKDQPRTNDAVAWISVTAESPSVMARELCEQADLRRERPFAAAAVGPEPPDAGAPCTEWMQSLLVATATRSDQQGFLLRIGPIITPNVDGWSAPWWERSQACLREDLDVIRQGEQARAIPTLQTVAGLEDSLLCGNAPALSERHLAIIDAMTVIERVDPLPGDDDPEHEENDPGYPAFPDLPERPQPLVSSSSVLDMVVWFEAMDTRQAWLRRWGLTQEADLIVTDMGAMARALECPMLEARITERLPKQALGFHSLIWHETWPTEAWELLSASEAMWRRMARVKSGFNTLFNQVQKDLRLDPRIMANLKERMTIVLADLPPGFDWSKTLGQEFSEYLIDHFTPTDQGRRVGYDSALMRTSDDLLAGRMVSQTSAWKIHGRIWGEDASLLPSERATRDMQHDLIGKTVMRLGNDPALSELWNAPDTPSMDRFMSRLNEQTSDRWNPWMVFPSQPGHFPHMLDEIYEDLSGIFETSPASGLGFLESILDSSIGTTGYRTGTTRYNLFNDCQIYATNEYVGLFSNRNYND